MFVPRPTVDSAPIPLRVSNLHPDVQKLLALQQLDQRIANIRRDLNAVPAETTRRERALGLVRQRQALQISFGLLVVRVHFERFLIIEACLLGSSGQSLQVAKVVVCTGVRGSRNLRRELALCRGEVTAVGSGRRQKDGSSRPVAVKQGEKVLFEKWAGSEIKIEGTEHLILREDEVLGVIE